MSFLLLCPYSSSFFCPVSLLRCALAPNALPSLSLSLSLFLLVFSCLRTSCSKFAFVPTCSHISHHYWSLSYRFLITQHFSSQFVHGCTFTVVPCAVGMWINSASKAKSLASNIDGWAIRFYGFLMVVACSQCSFGFKMDWISACDSPQPKRNKKKKLLVKEQHHQHLLQKSPPPRSFPLIFIHSLSSRQDRQKTLLIRYSANHWTKHRPRSSSRGIGY